MKPLRKKQGTEQGKGKNKKNGEKGLVLKRGRRSKKEEQEGKKS